MDILMSQVDEDLRLSGGDLIAITDQVDECVQRLFVRFKTFKREWFWNVDFGIDYLNDVFGKARSKDVIDTIFRNEILKEPMVSQILDFTSNMDGYIYSCSFQVNIREEVTTKTIYFLVNESGLLLTTSDYKEMYTEF